MHKRIKISHEEFAEMFEAFGGEGTATLLECTTRWVFDRRRKAERGLGRELVAPHDRHGIGPYRPYQVDLSIENGTVLIGSDCHYWPGIVTTMHRAFIHFCKKLRPKVVILNGDVLDLPSISRHASIGWESQPTVENEIDTAKKRLGEIEKVARNARFIWPAGNHDLRFETRLASVAPEYAKIYGVHLKDHFPMWQPCWLCVINDQVVVKHRFRGGIHATHNNVLWSGKTIITGHLHSARVTPFTDMNGTRYGVDTGTMAEPSGPQFVNYTEVSPVNWRSSFCVLTFEDGFLHPPELVFKKDENSVTFRSETVQL